MEYDRKYWPELDDASIMTMSINISDLWEQFPEHMSVLVAEALIDDPPSMLTGL